MHKVVLALVLVGWVAAAPAMAQLNQRELLDDKIGSRTTVHIPPPPSKNAGTINMIRTGWNNDSFAVVTSAPIDNPANCPDPDGYASMRTLPGYSTYLAAALTAYVTQSPVVITIDSRECAGTRPKLIGINLTK